MERHGGRRAPAPHRRRAMPRSRSSRSHDRAGLDGFLPTPTGPPCAPTSATWRLMPACRGDRRLSLTAVVHRLAPSITTTSRRCAARRPRAPGGYRVVVDAAPAPVSRDEVAAKLNVGRTLAAFHLDKLVAAGLLEASYARRTGRTGPGAGRPAKLYRRAESERAVSVPPRRYLSAAELLAEAVERAGADEALYEVAHRRGRAEAVPGADPVEVLAARGYEPTTRTAATIRLRNCPFHVLADEFPPLVCGMNLALIDGLLEGTGATGWRARLDPTPGHCCVGTYLKTTRIDL